MNQISWWHTHAAVFPRRAELHAGSNCTLCASVYCRFHGNARSENLFPRLSHCQSGKVIIALRLCHRGNHGCGLRGTVTWSQWVEERQRTVGSHEDTHVREHPLYMCVCVCLLIETDNTEDKKWLGGRGSDADTLHIKFWFSKWGNDAVWKWEEGKEQETENYRRKPMLCGKLGAGPLHWVGPGFSMERVHFLQTLLSLFARPHYISSAQTAARWL